jgi:APA family basic amino acid/polyamine antiporter
MLRRSRPDLPRSFRTPLMPWVPALSVMASLWLMLNLPAETWLRFAIWMVIGFGVYFLYGRSHSRLARHEESTGAAVHPPRPDTR